MPGALQKARTAEFPLVSGTGALGMGSSISLLSMHREGIVLLGRLEHLEGHIAHFRDARPQIREAVAGTRAEYKHLNDMADAHYASAAETPTDDARYLPEEVYGLGAGRLPRCIRLDAAGIGTIVAATGFDAQWPWLEVPGVLDPNGYPLASTASPRSRACSSSACTTCSDQARTSCAMVGGMRANYSEHLARGHQSLASMQ